MMVDFKQTSQVTLPKIKKVLTKEALAWHQSLEPSKVVKEFGLISHLDLHPSNNDLLVSSLSRISIYNINNMEARKTYQPMTSYSVFWASYRRTDHRLFTSSTEEGTINIFDIDNSKPLRLLGQGTAHAHVNAVRCSEFVKHNQVVSFSDDKHVKLWDIADGSMIHDIGSDDTKQITAHQDYVRCGCTVDMSPFLVVSGSYDHSLKVWDTREKSISPVFCFNLGAPVEAVASRCSFLACAASKTIKVFDLIAGKLMTTLSNIHSKTATSLRFYEDSLFTSSLDGHVNIFNQFFTPVTTFSYLPSQILTTAISQKAFVVGAVDGLVILKKFKPKETSNLTDLPAANIQMKNFRYFKHWKEEKSLIPDATLIEGVEKKNLNLPMHDQKLKKFDHSKALDLTLHRARSKPHVVVSLMQELIRRDTLRSALAGRSVDRLKYIVKFLLEYIRDPRFSRILVDVAIIFCDVYGYQAKESIPLQNLFQSLGEKVSLEVSLMKKMMVMAGEIDLILHNCMTN